jgi:DNA polymerase-3 subunit gamma/tau
MEAPRSPREPQRNVEASTAPRTESPPAPMADVAASSPADWAGLIERAGLRGPVGQLAQNATLIAIDGAVVRLAMDPSYEHLADGPMVGLLEQRLGSVLDRHVKVRFERAATGAQTPAEQRTRAENARRSAAEEAVHGDPFVQSMIDTFGARVIPDSIRPTDG